MIEALTPELVVLVVAIVGFFGTGAAMVIYFYVARQSKRRGKRPTAVIQDDLQALKNGPYRRLGKAIQKAASATSETLGAALTSVEDNLASTETVPGQPGRKPPSLSSRRALRSSPHEPAVPFPSSPHRTLEKPLAGTPGRTLDPLNLADEIDHVVRQRLQERSDLAQRRIRLATGLDGGLRIYVDGEVFKAVGDITDPKVRELIRDAIREWEGF